MNDVLRLKLHIGRKTVAEKQSISFGFSLVPEGDRTLDFEGLTYYGAGVTDRIDYLSLFPLGDVMRANLFTFLDHQDPWIPTCGAIRPPRCTRRCRACAISSVSSQSSKRSQTGPWT